MRDAAPRRIAQDGGGAQRELVVYHALARSDERGVVRVRHHEAAATVGGGGREHGRDAVELGLTGGERGGAREVVDEDR